MVVQQSGDEAASTLPCPCPQRLGDLEEGGLDIEKLPGGMEPFAAAPSTVKFDHAGLGEHPVGHVLEGVEVGSFGHRLGDGLDEVAPFEDRLLSGQPLRADQPLGQAAGHILGYEDGSGPPQRCDVSVGVDAHGQRLAPPQGAKVDRSPGAVVARFGCSGGQGGQLGRPPRAIASHREVLLDLGPAAGEAAQEGGICSDQFGRTTDDGTEADPEGLDQVGPERRLVDEASRAGMEVQQARHRGRTTDRPCRAPRWRRGRGCAAGGPRPARCGGRRRPPPVPRS